MDAYFFIPSYASIIAVTTLKIACNVRVLEAIVSVMNEKGHHNFITARVRKNYFLIIDIL